jgi:hypothetical protein
VSNLQTSRKCEVAVRWRIFAVSCKKRFFAGCWRIGCLLLGPRPIVALQAAIGQLASLFSLGTGFNAGVATQIRCRDALEVTIGFVENRMVTEDTAELRELSRQEVG